MPTAIFLDTMIFLHYKPLEEIDWRGLLDSEHVRIVVPRITISELDRHKDSHSNRKVKDRARRILQFLERLAANERAELREGVEIERYSRRPSFELGTLDLDPDQNDDMMVASALEFQRQNPGLSVILISEDATPRMTAKDLGLQAMELSEEFKIRGEVDPVELENRELRRELERFKNARPKLSLCFRDSEPRNRLLIQLTRPPEFSHEAVRKELARVQAEHPVYAARAPATPLSSVQLILDRTPAEGEVARYEADRQRYFREYAGYLRTAWKTQCLRMLTFRLALDVVNEGTAVAEDVDVHLHLPDGFKLLEQDAIQVLEGQDPKPPSPPVRPRSQIHMLNEQMRSLSDLHRSPYTPDLSYLAGSFRPGPPPNVSRPEIEETNSYNVQFKVRQVKHLRAERLEVLAGIFADFDSASSFGINYHLHAANLPDEAHGELHVIVEKSEG